MEDDIDVLLFGGISVSALNTSKGWKRICYKIEGIMREKPIGIPVSFVTWVPRKTKKLQQKSH